MPMFPLAASGYTAKWMLVFIYANQQAAATYAEYRKSQFLLISHMSLEAQTPFSFTPKICPSSLLFPHQQVTQDWRSCWSWSARLSSTHCRPHCQTQPQPLPTLLPDPAAPAADPTLWFSNPTCSAFRILISFSPSPEPLSFNFAVIPPEFLNSHWCGLLPVAVPTRQAHLVCTLEQDWLSQSIDQRMQLLCLQPCHCFSRALKCTMSLQCRTTACMPCLSFFFPTISFFMGL